jgi:phosphatidylglycerophosphate synthase
MRAIAPRLVVSADSPTDGELWAQEALRELRQAKFAPAAWITFLSASFARARLRRRERRQEHRQVLALAATGSVAWIAVALAGRPALAALGVGWWLLVLLMLDWHLGMLERPNGRPLNGLGVPNLLSLLRAGVVPLLLFVPPHTLAVLLFAAGGSDVVDGWVARRFDRVSRLGRWLDPVVDGFVLGVAALAAARSQLLPVWVAALVAARYVLPWIVVALVYFSRAETPDRGAYVSGRLPGTVVIIGLGLAALHLPAAVPVVVVGSCAGLLTFMLTIARALGCQRDQRTGAPGVARASLSSTSTRPRGNS